MTQVYKAITRSYIPEGKQHLRPMNSEENLQAKNDRYPELISFKKADLLEDQGLVARKGRLPAGPWKMHRVDIKALRLRDHAHTNGQDVYVTRQSVIKAPGWNESPYPTKAHTSALGGTVATGGMTVCLGVGLIGDATRSPAARAAQQPSMASVLHVYPLNQEAHIRASIKEDVELMRGRGTVVSAGIAGGDASSRPSVQVERIVRDELRNLNVPIRPEHDRAGQRRDGLDSSFVQAAQVGPDNIPRLGNTLRIVE